MGGFLTTFTGVQAMREHCDRIKSLVNIAAQAPPEQAISVLGVASELAAELKLSLLSKAIDIEESKRAKSLKQQEQSSGQTDREALSDEPGSPDPQAGTPAQSGSGDDSAPPV